MKTLTCHDAGGFVCPYVAKGETEEEVIKQITEHGKAVHPKEVEEMEKSMSADQMQAMLRSKIKEE